MKRSVSFLLFMLAACSAAGLLAPVFPLFDLFNPFRIHALVASVALCILGAFVGRKFVFIALAIFVFNGVLVAQRLYQSGGIVPIEQISDSSMMMMPLRTSIIAANVYTRNDNHPAVLAMIAREKPAIVVFTETDERWVNALSALEPEYPYTVKHPRSDNFGMAVYSKLPFKANVLEIGSRQFPLAVLDFEEFRLIGAHPVPPVSSHLMAENTLYIEAITQNVRNTDKPVIVAGDLNSTLWSHSITPLLAADLKRINPTGIAYTWPTQMPLFAMQIDHFFARNIAAADFEVLENIGSDHYPIKTDIALDIFR